jgi:hypothetical protein
MNLDFDLKKVKTLEFGVGTDIEDEQKFYLIHTDKSVQGALKEMVIDTWRKLSGSEIAAVKYEPSEKFSSNEYVTLDLHDEFAKFARQLHTADNIESNNDSLDSADSFFCYFARFKDDQGRRLTAVRRAIHFKGALKERLIKFSTETLKLVEDKIFKLDFDFDFISDSKTLHILRPSAFEFVAGLQEAVLNAAPRNLKSIAEDIPYVDFANIEAYSTSHPRAARYIASIRSLKQTHNINKAALKALCKATHVIFTESNGKIVIDQSNALGFLEVLDRRRYQLELVSGAPEQFRAASRARIAK